MCIKRTQCRNKYRNIGNLWKRVYNTVEITLLLHCNAFKILLLIKISGWFYLAPLFSIFISSIPQNLDFSGQINCWSFITNQVDHILLIKMKSSCSVSWYPLESCSGTQDTEGVLHLSSPLELECRACGGEFPLQVGGGGALWACTSSALTVWLQVAVVSPSHSTSNMTSLCTVVPHL